MADPTPSDITESERDELRWRRISEKVLEDIDRSVKRRYRWMAVIAVVATWLGGAGLLTALVQAGVDKKIDSVKQRAESAVMDLQKLTDKAEYTADQAHKTAEQAQKTAEQAQKTLTELQDTLKRVSDETSDLKKTEGDLSAKANEHGRSLVTLSGQVALAKQQLLELVAGINKSSVKPNPAVAQAIQTIRARDQWIAQYFLPTYENPCIGPGCYEVVVSEWPTKEEADTERKTLEATYPEIGFGVWQSDRKWAVVIAMGITQSDAQRLKRTYQGKLNVDYHDRGNFSSK